MLDDTLRLTLDDIYPPVYAFYESQNENKEKENSKEINKEKDCSIKETKTIEENQNASCNPLSSSNSITYISPFPVDTYSNSENLW